jgi:ATP-dependent Clp protease adaptor protein ClpS
VFFANNEKNSDAAARDIVIKSTPTRWTGGRLGQKLNCDLISSMADFPDIERDSEVLTESETKLEKPKLFKVLLHNDDFTTMEFVIFVLQYVFNKNDMDALTVMLKVHNEGVGIAGIYPYEIAKTKSEKTMNLARAREYPLLCTVEAE